MNIRELKPTDFQVGQTVALRYSGSEARLHLNNDKFYFLSEITEISKTSIHCRDIQIDVETGYDMVDGKVSYKLYASEEHVLEDLRSERISRDIRLMFNRFEKVDVSFEKLKQVADILDINYDELKNVGI